MIIGAVLVAVLLICGLIEVLLSTSLGMEVDFLTCVISKQFFNLIFVCGTLITACNRLRLKRQNNNKLLINTRRQKDSDHT